MRKTTIEEICEKIDGAYYNPKDQKMNICLQKGLGYVDRSNDPLGLTFDKSQERPHRFFFIPRGDYEVIGWVELRDGKLRGSGVDVKLGDDGTFFIWKGKRFPEGLYYLVRFDSGREVLYDEVSFLKLR
mgnify:FL=1